MSLFIIGGLKKPEQGIAGVRQHLDQASQRTGICVSYDVDEDDREYLDTVLEVSSDSLLFSLQDGAESGDVTTSWISAMTMARSLITTLCPDVNVAVVRHSDLGSLPLGHAFFDAMLRCPLASCISAIIGEVETTGGAISIFDGSSEREVLLSSDECVKEIMRTMILPWDCLPNTTYIWEKAVHMN